jgi:hypothetical protein
MRQVVTLFDNLDDDLMPEQGENQRIKDMATLQDGFTSALINLSWTQTHCCCITSPTD